MNTNLKSDLMNIKALEREYNSVLKQYEEAYKNCNSKLHAVANTNTKSFTSFDNRSYWGSGGLKEGTVASQAACETMCASDVKCTGATFNTDNNYCWARSGNGPLSVSVHGSSDKALLPDVTACVITLKTLNTRMLEINKQLTTAIDNSSPQVEIQNRENESKRDALHKYYAQLLAERIQMDELVKENETIDAEYTNQSLIVEQQNGSLRFWILIACVISLIIVNQMIGKTSSVASIFWLFIMIALIVVSFSIGNVSGFAVWTMLILIIVLMKMGIIPSPQNDTA